MKETISQFVVTEKNDEEELFFENECDLIIMSLGGKEICRFDYPTNFRCVAERMKEIWG